MIPSRPTAVPATVGELLVDFDEVGDFVPQMHVRRYTGPVRGGVSTGPPQLSAGTLGCLVVIANHRLCLLSNNHVIANSNNESATRSSGPDEPTAGRYH